MWVNNKLILNNFRISGKIIRTAIFYKRGVIFWYETTISVFEAVPSAAYYRTFLQAIRGGAGASYSHAYGAPD